ncbi:MAG TPA: TetR/AcrR family transcriptional regulator [Usitatibacter sp.]|nr:TetR/AcrR family transcriptional regulator [Usitatibacter sp.]
MKKPAAHSTRERLVTTAMTLFWEKGYDSTSVADVLQKAGVNSGSLYHFFPGKQDLLLAVLDLYHRGIGPMLLEPAWKGVEDPVERVFALLARYRQGIVMTRCTYGCPIGSLALEIHEPDPPVREALARNFAAWVAAIEECLAAARERFAPGTDRRALAEFVLTTMEGAVMQSRTHRDVAYFDRSVAQLRNYFDLLTTGKESTHEEDRRTRRVPRGSPAPRKRR